MSTIKIQFNEDIRRVLFPLSVPFAEIKKQTFSKFAIPHDKEISLKYFDGEDNCLISSDAELEEALLVAADRKCLLKIMVSLKEAIHKPHEPAKKKKSPESYFDNEEPELLPGLNLIQQLFMVFFGFFCRFVGLFRRFVGLFRRSLLCSASREVAPRRFPKLRMFVIAFIVYIFVFHIRFLFDSLRFAFVAMAAIFILLLVLFCLLLCLFPLVKLLFSLISITNGRCLREMKNNEFKRKESFARKSSPREEPKPKLNNFELLNMYKYEMQHLWDMGFVNNLRNLELLQIHSGDLGAALLQLLSEK